MMSTTFRSRRTKRNDEDHDDDKDDKDDDKDDKDDEIDSRQYICDRRRLRMATTTTRTTTTTTTMTTTAINSGRLRHGASAASVLSLLSMSLLMSSLSSSLSGGLVEAWTLPRLCRPAPNRLVHLSRPRPRFIYRPRVAGANVGVGARSLLASSSSPTDDGRNDDDDEEKMDRRMVATDDNRDRDATWTPAPTQAVGLNELQTLLREAVRAEDYDAASRLRDALAERVSSGAYRPTGDRSVDRRYMRRLSWRGLGTAPWLEGRLDALGYKFPTTIQINAFESINCMLGAFHENGDNDDDDDDDVNGGGASSSSSSSSVSAARLFGDYDEDETLEERMGRERSPNMGIVVSGSTGSGKTLAYLVPMLSTLSESLYTRQRIRVKAEEDIGDAADDLLARVAVQTSPTIRGRGRRMVGGGGGGAIAAGASLSTLGKSGTDVRSPLALIVVPTRELGVQTALLLYECVGGSTKRTMTQMLGPANSFKYKGPKGVKIGCILDKEEAKFGLKLQTDIAITTPEFLGKLIRDGDVVPSKLRVVVYDEADLALEQTKDEDLNALFRDGENDRDFSRLTYLVGASVTESLGKLAVRDSVLPEGKSFIATATRFAPLSTTDDVPGKDGTASAPFDSTTMTTTTTTSTTATDADADADADADESKHNENEERKDAINRKSSPAYLKDLGYCLDPGLRHERVVAPNETGMLCLARMLRRELREYEAMVASANSSAPTASSWDIGSGGMDGNSTVFPMATGPATATANGVRIQRPRVVVFFPGEEEAKSAVSPMRDALWGEHKLCVLLPNIGNSPLEIMEQFKSGGTSVMLATPNSVRGLDFANLTHVYTLYLPANDPREYVHLAGRVGRIGQLGSVYGCGGRVTSILRPDEADKMVDLAKELNFDFVDLEYASAGIVLPGDGGSNMTDANVEDLRRYLEDTITLLDTADELEVDINAYESRRASAVDSMDDDEEEEEDDDDDDDDDDDVKEEDGSVRN